MTYNGPLDGLTVGNERTACAVTEILNKINIIPTTRVRVKPCRLKVITHTRLETDR